MELFYGSVVFVVVPFMLSNGIAVYFTHTWLRSTDINSHRLVKYVESFDKLIYGLTVFCGFYATIDLITSKIYTHNVFYFSLMKSEKMK